MLRLLIAALILLAAPITKAETDEIRVARQFGINYLPLIVMEQSKVLEKKLEENGLKETKIKWLQLGDAMAINESLISGNLDFATTGPAPFIKLWDKTKDNIEVKAVAALNVIPMHLITNNEAIKSVKDFTAKDKIALPGTGISTQAIVLQMAAEKAFGEKNYKELDKYTITMSHPDATGALLSGKSIITAHFSTPPFSFDLLHRPEFHAVISSEEILGGPSIGNVVFTTAKFRDKNPKVYKAFLEALEESIAFINKNKKEAAEIYVKSEQSNYDKDFILKLLNNPAIKFQTTPLNIIKYADFMYKTQLINEKPKNWKSLFFLEIHEKKGS